MTKPEKKSSFPYWVFAVPLACIGFVGVAMDGLDLDDDVVFPTAIMSCLALGVIGAVRARQGRGIFKHSHWGWFVAGPVLLLVVLAIFDELDVPIELFMPAMFFTTITSMIVFTKRPNGDEHVEPTVTNLQDIDERVEQIVAARMAEAGLRRERHGSLWGWLFLGFIGVSALAVVAPTLESRRDIGRSAVSEQSRNESINWRSIVELAERESRNAKREAELALRSAERREAEIVRATERGMREQAQEQAILLAEETRQKQHQVAELQRQAADAKRAAQEKIRQVIRQTLQGKIDIDVEGISADANGVEIRIMHDDEPMVAKFDSQGYRLEPVRDIVVNIDGIKDNETCELDDESCTPCELKEREAARLAKKASASDVTVAVAEAGSGATTVTAIAKAEVDSEEEWEHGEQDWEEIAGELHKALFDELKERGSEDQKEALLSARKSAKRRSLQEEWIKDKGRDKPAWALEGNDLTGATHRLVAITGPCETQQECLKERNRQIRETVIGYTDGLVSRRVQLPGTRINELVMDEYFGIHQSETAGVGDLPVIYTLLEVDEKFRENLVESVRKQTVSRTRMTQTGIGSFGILGMLASVFGYLKLDERTGGTKRARLKLGATSGFALAAVTSVTAIILVQHYL